MKPLTTKQLRVLNAIRDYREANDGLMPTHKDIAEAVGCSRATASHHIHSLADKGYLRRSRNWRDMELVR